MTLYEASFRVKHECSYRVVAEHYPGLTTLLEFDGRIQHPYGFQSVGFGVVSAPYSGSIE
ncbi:hypothetical protein [Natrinema salaciae]|uniref:hypothetical protein n=1 Tax=Natrinema salaciae TaxID=1186196 RepID=UPI000B85A009|nr:hypothetical protein [Natrinema salaciae]